MSFSSAQHSRLARALAGLALLAACPQAAHADGAEAEYPLPQFGGWGFNPGDIDRSVHPGDDFFAYVNGKWTQREVIPARYPYSGASLALRLGAERTERAIIEDLAAHPQPKGSLEQRIADTWHAFLDRPGIDAAGLAPARFWLDRIAKAPDRAALAALMGEPGIPSPIAFAIEPDPENPAVNRVFASFARLGLPDRDYYLGASVRAVAIQTRYRAHLAFLLGRSGFADSAALAERVYAFEARIAALDWDRAVARNPLLVSNRVTREAFEAWGSPQGFPLASLLAASGLDHVDRLIVREVPPSGDRATALGLAADSLAKLGAGFPALVALLGSEDPATIKAWMTAQFLIGHAAVLPSDIDAANFEFYGRLLQGKQQERERWQRGIDAVDAAMGEAVGKIYVARAFPPASRAAMIRLVANLRASLATDLSDLAWMSPATRAAARAKLDQLTVKIGYPDRFRTYDGLVVRADAPLANAIEAARWQWQEQLQDLAQGVDRTRWRMTPQTVNAYYRPSANEIVFPAAILQPPFFNPHADDAVNYGAIGVVIGHEIGHGYDDRGSRYDGSGMLRDWWSEADRKAFEARTGKLVEQYDHQCPFDEGKTCHNGALTLGENIGDLAGMAMAWQAYHLSLKGKPAKVIDGLTGDQRFFLAYAQIWREKMREEFARQLLKTDPHSLAATRVNAVVRNFDPWYQAFAVKPGDKLYLPPADRVHIW